MQANKYPRLQAYSDEWKTQLRLQLRHTSAPVYQYEPAGVELKTFLLFFLSFALVAVVFLVLLTVMS